MVLLDRLNFNRNLSARYSAGQRSTRAKWIANRYLSITYWKWYSGRGNSPTRVVDSPIQLVGAASLPVGSKTRP